MLRNSTKFLGLLLILVVMAAPLSVFAQEDLTETYTAEGGWLTFNHPAGWVFEGTYPELEGGNSAEAADKATSELTASDLQFNVLDGVALMAFVTYEAGASNGEILTVIMGAIMEGETGVTLQPQVDVTGTTHPISYVIGVEEGDSEALIGLVEVAPGQNILFGGASAVGSVQAYVPTIIAIADSMQYDATAVQAINDAASAVDASVTPGAPTVYEVVNLGPVAGSVVWQQHGEATFTPEAFGTFGDVEVGADDTIYLVDSNSGVLTFDADGNQTGNITSDEIFSVADIAIAEDGTLWLADEFNNKVYHVDAQGAVLGSFGEAGTGDGQFGTISPARIEIGPDGKLYLFDSNSNEAGETIGRIQVWNTDGTFERSFSTNVEGDFGFAFDPDMAFGADGNLYLADFSGIRVFNPADGSIVTESFAETVTDQVGVVSLAIAPDGKIALGTNNYYGGSIYVVDPASGKVVSQFGAPQASPGDGASSVDFVSGEFYAPGGMEFLSNGDLIVADTNYSFSQLVRINLAQ